MLYGVWTMSWFMCLTWNAMWIPSCAANLCTKASCTNVDDADLLMELCANSGQKYIGSAVQCWVGGASCDGAGCCSWLVHYLTARWCVVLMCCCAIAASLSTCGYVIDLQLYVCKCNDWWMSRRTDEFFDTGLTWFYWQVFSAAFV